jgi:hypothetical protein
MTEKTTTENPADRRSEIRENLEKIKSLELKLPSLPIYLFRVKDTSSDGICFVVKGDSDILNHIQLGQILDVRYHAEDITKPSEVFTSEIKHITEIDKGPNRNYQIVGLMILEKGNQSRSAI